VSFLLLKLLVIAGLPLGPGNLCFRRLERLPQTARARDRGRIHVGHALAAFLLERFPGVLLRRFDAVDEVL
jgi:hypothetical protein